MPDGNTTITPACWQPVPGESLASIWPYIRKADNVSSNTYVIRSGDLTLIVDPGGLPAQADEISAVARETPTPCTLALLTHAHADHFAPLMDHPYFSDRSRVLLAVHEAGARALATADPFITQCDLLERAIAPVRASIPLFSRSAVGRGGGLTVACSTGARIHLDSIIRTAKDGTRYPEEILHAEDSCPVVLYHTPGHSPDSICIRIGSLLFIGDLLFAAAPGVAGMSGWNREELVRSIDAVLAILEEGLITHCLPGHGYILTCEDAVRALRGVKRDAAALEGIVELNLPRAKEAASYAQGLMDEVGGIFTVISARLLFVSHVLEELEESGEADAVGTLIDVAKLDDLLNDFHRFSEEFHAGNKGNVQLALKAGQIVGKLERMFAQQDLALVLDPEYVNRAGRLLADYTTVLRGFRQPRMAKPAVVAPFVADLVRSLNPSPAINEELMGALDDQVAFTRSLIRKIARQPVFGNVTCSCGDEAKNILSEIDTTVLGDLLRSILEDLAGSGSRAIAVHVSSANAIVSIGIVPAPAVLPEPGDVRRRFLQNECARAGGELVWIKDPACIRIDLPEMQNP